MFLPVFNGAMAPHSPRLPRDFIVRYNLLPCFDGLSNPFEEEHAVLERSSRPPIMSFYGSRVRRNMVISPSVPWTWQVTIRLIGGVAAQSLCTCIRYSTPYDFLRIFVSDRFPVPPRKIVPRPFASGGLPNIPIPGPFITPKAVCDSLRDHQEIDKIH